MPIWIDLDDAQITQIAKDLIPQVRRTIKDFEERLDEYDHILLSADEKQLLLK